MRRCDTCGKLNLKRLNLKDPWLCEQCQSPLKPKGQDKFPKSLKAKGCYRTAKKLQHDEYPWDHENS